MFQAPTGHLRNIRRHDFNSFLTLSVKMHKENILSNQIHEEPNQQDIPQKDFIMNSNHLMKYNIIEDGKFKNATAIKYTKTFEQENKHLDVSAFNKIIQSYYNHFKKPIIIYFGVNVEYKK